MYFYICILLVRKRSLERTRSVSGQSELSRAEHRGSHVSGFGIYVGTGLAVATRIDFGTSHVKGSVSWRLPRSIPAIMALVVMATIFTVLGGSFFPRQWEINADGLHRVSSDGLSRCIVMVKHAES